MNKETENGKKRESNGSLSANKTASANNENKKNGSVVNGGGDYLSNGSASNGLYKKSQ